MQIHELNKRQKVNEVDLFGPGGIAAVGKQVLKNPKAMWNSSQLGAAQQAANQAHSTSSANALAAQGYKVGGGIKPAVTTAQQLQVVKANPAVQQQVKNLSAQWMTQSQSLKKASSSAPITEAGVAFDPRDITDPKYASLVQALQAKGGLPINPTPEQTASTETELEKKLTIWKNQFKTWSDARLETNGITVDNVRTDPVTAKMLDSAMSNVAVAAQAGDANIEKTAVEEYFNIAIAAIQAYVNDKQQTSQASRSAPAAGATQTDTDVLSQLQQQGVPVSKASVESLGKAMIAANNGNNAVRDTGNPILNAIARLAGMRITS